MDNGNSLDDILNGTPAPDEAPAAETPPVVEAEEAAEKPGKLADRERDELGRLLPKGDHEPAAEAAPAESAPPAPDDDTSPTVPRAALTDERRKRQTLEAQLAEMNQRLVQFQQPAPQAPQPIPDQWDEPEAYVEHLVREASTVAREEALAEVRRERVMQSAEAAKVKYPDYLEKVAVFEQLSQANPALTQSMIQQSDPAAYAYGIAKQHLELSQYGSLEERDAALKAKWEAEALERLKASLPASSAPPTLAGERNVGNRSGPEWSGPRPLSDILS